MNPLTWIALMIIFVICAILIIVGLFLENKSYQEKSDIRRNKKPKSKERVIFKRGDNFPFD